MSMLMDVLNDMQERLVYCTHSYVRDFVGGYEPDAAALDYPALLAGDRKEEKDLRKKVKRTVRCTPRGTPHSSARFMPVKIYRCVDKGVFEGLAQDAVNACTASLFSASATIRKNASDYDGDLFLVKHLLILRERFPPFVNCLRGEASRLYDDCGRARPLCIAAAASLRFDSTNALVELWKRAFQRWRSTSKIRSSSKMVFGTRASRSSNGRRRSY